MSALDVSRIRDPFAALPTKRRLHVRQRRWTRVRTPDVVRHTERRRRTVSSTRIHRRTRQQPRDRGRCCFFCIITTKLLQLRGIIWQN